MPGPLLFDRIRESASTTGTGDFALDGAVSGGFQAFSSVLTINDTTYYVIQNPTFNEWEVGIGTLTGTTTLQRTTVLSSSNTGSLVNFSAGTKSVFADAPAALLSINGLVLEATPDTSNDLVAIYDVSSGGVKKALLSSISSGGTTLPVADTQTIVKGSVDATKLLRFEVDGFTAGATRVLTPPDQDGTIAVLERAQTFTVGPQTIDGSSDAVQLVVEGNATQTNYLQTWRNSSAQVFASVDLAPAFLLKQATGTRTYSFGIDEAAGRHEFERSDTANGIYFGSETIPSTYVTMGPLQTLSDFVFQVVNGDIIFTPNVGGGVGIVQFGRRFSDSANTVGASNEFWPTNTQTEPVLCSVMAGGGTGGASPVAYRFVVDPTGDIYLRAESSTTNARDRLGFVAIWADSTDATRKARLTVSIYDTSARTAYILDTDGSGANFSFFAAGSYGSGRNVIFLPDAAVAPSTDPVGGGILYAAAGALLWRGSGATVTTLAAAGPHCGRCGYDFWSVACRNDKWNAHLYICGMCGKRYRKGPKSVLHRLTTEQQATVLEN